MKVPVTTPTAVEFSSFLSPLVLEVLMQFSELTPKLKTLILALHASAAQWGAGYRTEHPTPCIECLYPQCQAIRLHGTITLNRIRGVLGWYAHVAGRQYVGTQAGPHSCCTS